jgi:hypothetical protein
LVKNIKIKNCSYGCPVHVRTNEQLFTVAYLAKKFKVTGLTKMMDGLLKYLPTAWKQNDIRNWKITLNICKWLELDQTQLEISNYLKKNYEENEMNLNFGKDRKDYYSAVKSSDSSSSSSSSSSGEESDS